MSEQFCQNMTDPGSGPDNAGNPLIEMRAIYKIFQTGAGDFTALNGVDVCFFEGEFVSVVGKSGSGKSTLVNMLTGIDHPTSGSVRVGNTTIHKLTEGEMSIWRGRNLGIVFQFFQLLPMLSLLENIMLPMDFAKLIPFQQRESRAWELLELVGLQDHAHELPAEIAGGQQQSAAIARALANDPPIVIADEPTGNLDSRSADAVFKIFTNLAQQGKTVIMVTHDGALAQRTDRSMLLSDGELVNGWITKAFPNLPHPRLLWLTHNMQVRSLDQGEIVSLPTGQQEALYLFTSGQVELITRNGYFGNRKVRLGAGDYLAQTDLQVMNGEVTGMRNISGKPVQALVLDGAVYQEWLHGAAGDQDLLRSAAEMRIASWRANSTSEDQN
jgi:putative ABC transport system ATP-binding protein